MLEGQKDVVCLSGGCALEYPRPRATLPSFPVQSDKSRHWPVLAYASCHLERFLSLAGCTTFICVELAQRPGGRAGASPCGPSSTSPGGPAHFCFDVAKTLSVAELASPVRLDTWPQYQAGQTRRQQHQAASFSCVDCAPCRSFHAPPSYGRWTLRVCVTRHLSEPMTSSGRRWAPKRH